MKLSSVNPSRKMSVHMLREELPEWSWRAVRHGIGWSYEGHRGERRVTIIACAVLVGPLDDDTATRWMVYEIGETYATWYCREKARLKEEARNGTQDR